MKAGGVRGLLEQHTAPNKGMELTASSRSSYPAFGSQQSRFGVSQHRAIDKARGEARKHYPADRRQGTWYTDAMRIDYIVCPDNIADKIASKHRMTVREARQVLLSKPRIRFAEKGHIANNDVYAAFGQTFSGRYVVVFFVYKPDTATAIIISARDMSPKERRAYGRK
jgi:uncharacterized DUF497 family protein